MMKQRVMEAQQIYVKDQSRAGEVASRLANGEDFRTVAADYNEAAQIDITFGRDEMPKEVEDIAFNLNDDEISGSIATEGWLLFLSSASINSIRELTDANKVKIVKNVRKKHLMTNMTLLWQTYLQASMKKSGMNWNLKQTEP